MKLDELTLQAGRDIVIETIRPPGECDNPEIRRLEYDSRRVGPGTLFFAVKGRKADGHRYIGQAVERGAAAVASERLPPEGFALPWVRVRRIRQAMAVLADRFHGGLSGRMTLAGVTGTNGKTTTGYLLHSILNQEAPALLMGTVQVLFGEESQDAVLTTPEAIDIQRGLALAWQKGCRAGVLEVSSHALDQYRVYGCRFPVGVFTNLSRDHLDYHRTFDGYFQAKSRLFDPQYNPAIRWAVLNGDDEWTRQVEPPPNGGRIRFGFSEDNEVRVLRWSGDVSGSRMELNLLGRPLEIETPLAGRHNIYNVMAAAAAAAALGREDQAIARGVASLRRVPGRFERVEADHPAAIFVDFAHTPDALENVLRLCRQLTRGKVLCVFGCGGDRDKEKRPLMGDIASRLADRAIITSDNPRSENPQRIIDEVRQGVSAERLAKVQAVAERRRAVARALEQAGRDDLVLIAGKGHETYQEIDGERRPFDDRKVIREVLES